MMHRSNALRASAREESCVACGAEGTVVWAHRNEGKGMGIKGHDLLGLYLCAYCHDNYDNFMAKEDAREFFKYHYPATMERVAKKLASGEILL